MQRFFSYTLIIVMSLSIVIPAAIPFYEICLNQLTGAVMEDLVEEGFAERMKKKIQVYSTCTGPENQEHSGGTSTSPGRNWEAGWVLQGKINVARSTVLSPA
ncbi:MAG: hypothetical protein ACKO4W_09420, partial [Bacteroidota bacterium]